MWINAIKTTKASVDIADSNAIFTLGIRSDLDEPLAATDRIADPFFEVNGPVWTQQVINSLFNGGVPPILGGGPTLIVRPELTGQTGQKLSVRADLTRETDAAIPSLSWAGIING